MTEPTPRDDHLLPDDDWNAVVFDADEYDAIDAVGAQAQEAPNEG